MKEIAAAVELRRIEREQNVLMARLQELYRFEQHLRDKHPGLPYYILEERKDDTKPRKVMKPRKRPCYVREVIVTE
jgi:hypothetical protein